MAENTGIEWADHTFNPWIGCTRISPACDHCYAARIDHRFGGGHWGAGAPRKRTSPANWAQPLRWNRQAAEAGARPRVFCASLADVFDNEVPVEWRIDLFELIRQTPNLDWLLLTKRIGAVKERLREVHEALVEKPRASQAFIDWVDDWRTIDGLAPSNIWLGATVVNQTEADRDVPKLLATPAAVRFLSIEPMLGAINLRRVFGIPHNAPFDALAPDGCAQHAPGYCFGDCEDRFGALDWIIAGGESGPKARPSHPDWFRLLRDQCVEAGVPFLFKQWGEWNPLGQALADGDINAKGSPRSWYQFDDGEAVEHVGKKAAGRNLDGRTWDELPVRP